MKTDELALELPTELTVGPDGFHRYMKNAAQLYCGELF